MHSKYEEVLIETITDQQEGFRFSPREKHMNNYNTYPMSPYFRRESSNEPIHYEIPHETKPLTQLTQAQIQTEQIKTPPIELMQKPQPKPFTSSFHYPSSSLSTSKLPQIQNIVSTASLKCQLNLQDIALKVKHAEYNPEAFAAVVIKIAESKATAFISSLGKVICYGAKTEEASKKTVRKIAKMIHKLGYPVKLTDFKIQNLIGAIEIKQDINLKDLAQLYSHCCSYNPEVFSGLIFQIPSMSLKTIVFSTGEMIFTGTNDRNDIYKAYTSLCPILLQFRQKSIQKGGM